MKTMKTYNFNKLSILVDDSNMIVYDDKISGLYFKPFNYKKGVTRKEIHEAIDYCKKALNIENVENSVVYRKIMR